MNYVVAFKKRWATISNDLDSPTVVHPKTLLAQQDLRPQKKLGQNFLIPRPWAKKVLGHITEKPIETVVEIGPGLGAIGPSNNWGHLTEFAKWLTSFCMLLGRLEIFTVMVLFSRSFWKV